MWRRLMVYNKITDDRRLAPGATLRIPITWLKLTATTVRVVTIVGTVEVNTGAGWQSAPPGLELAKGHRLRTQEQSTANLSLGDGVTALIRANSELVIETTGRAVGNGALLLRLELVRGGLESEAHTLRRNGGLFEIETPVAVTSVRGTTFRVSTESGLVRTEVLDGSVGVGNAIGAVVLPAATGSRVERIRVPEAPRTLLAAPDLKALPEEVVNPPLRISFPALRDATGYRLQVLTRTTASSGDTPSVLTEVVDNHPTVPDLPDGQYVVRVRGIDGVGLEGRNAEHKITVVHRAPPPPPPANIAAWQDVDVQGSALRLTWVGPDPAGLFQVQILRQDDTNAPVLLSDRYVRNTQLTLPRPPVGRYVVRVRVAPQVGQDPAWSDARAFQGAMYQAGMDAGPAGSARSVP